MMQKGGVPSMHSTSSKSPEWFEDHRYQPNQQAQYLKKLGRLREDLIKQDIYTQKRPTALNHPTGKTDVPPEKYGKHKENGKGGYNALMDRQKKLQQERMKYFQRHRGGGGQIGEKVGKIDIRPLTDVGPLVETDQIEDATHGTPYESARAGDGKFASSSFANEKVPKMSKVSLPYLTSPSQNFTPDSADLMHHDVINDMIDSERKRARDKKELDMLHYASSIPNIGRRALKHPGPLLNHPFEPARSRHDSYVKQVSIHKKDRRGIFKSKKDPSRKRIAMLRADADEIDLTPELLSFYSSKYLDDDDSIMAPCTTPNLRWSDTEQQYRPYTKEDLTELRNQFHRHRTHTETSIDLTHSKPKQDHDHEMPSKSCIFCRHPEYLPFAIPASEYMVLPGDQATPRGHMATSPRVPKLKYHDEIQSKKSLLRVKKRNIVVDLPQMEESVPSFILNSPSPNASFHNDLPQAKSQVEQHRNGVLYKTFKQNELRKREITHLLEDVRELNQLTKHFEENGEGSSEEDDDPVSSV